MVNERISKEAGTFSLTPTGRKMNSGSYVPELRFYRDICDTTEWKLSPLHTVAEPFCRDERLLLLTV